VRRHRTSPHLDANSVIVSRESFIVVRATDLRPLLRTSPEPWLYRRCDRIFALPREPLPPVKVRGQDYEYGYGLKCRVGLLKLELVLEFSVRVRVVGYDLGSGLLLRLDVLVKTVRCR